MSDSLRSLCVFVLILALVAVCPSCSSPAGGGGGGGSRPGTGPASDDAGDDDAGPDDPASDDGTAGDGTSDDDAAGDDDESPVPYTGDYVFDPDIYVGAIDPARVIAVDAGMDDAPDVEFPVNQLIMLLYPGSPRSAAERVADATGGTIVGQVPARDYYQIELPTTTRAELDAAIAQARTDIDVEAVSYNLLAVPLACPEPSDLYEMLLFPSERCPFTEIDYYNALTIFEQVRDQIFPLHPVIVAVLDSGIQEQNGEFDDITIINLNDINAPAEDRIEHGTLVASLIAADDDNAGINGIASRILDGRLILLSAGATGPTHADYYAAAERAITAGVEIMNMSFGWAHYTTGIDLAAIRAAWRNMFLDNPDVLFVAAADNRRYEITADNYAPGGIDLPNVITVGGTALCSAHEAWARSATGPRIDVAAPAETIPCASKDNGHVLLHPNGNSLSTPMVTSLATIIKSIYPALTPEEIKLDYILNYGYPTDEAVGGARIALAPCIEQVIIDRSPSVPYDVLDLVDEDINDHHDVPGLVINRICSGLNYSVDYHGTYDYPADVLNDPGIHVTGTVAAGSFTLEALVSEDAHLLMVCPDGAGCIFELNQEYIIHEEALDLPGYVAVSYTKQPASHPSEAIGLGVDGSLVFESCRIDQRSGSDGRIQIVNLSGQFKGTLEVVLLDGSTQFAGLEGYFSIPYLTAGLGAEEDLQVYLEENCEGGIYD